MDGSRPKNGADNHIGGYVVRYAASVFLVMTCLGAASAAAEPALGTWATEPDRKGQIGHVQVRQCGAEVCGKIIRAFAPDGTEIVTKNVGKEIFWSMKPLGEGGYSDGRVFVPIMGRDYAGSMKLFGKSLEIRGCNGIICKAQTWKRVK